MLRIILGGANMEGFPLGHESANFKLLLPRDGQHAPVLPSEGINVADDQKPTVRTYTLRSYDAEKAELAVDFLLHEDHGPASQWAISAKPGSQVGFAGPGAPKLPDPDADWFLFAGDMSALPAISANIERLEPDAKGYAVLEIIDPADQQQLAFPSAFEVDWVINPQPTAGNSPLIEAVKKLPWLEGTPGVWIAGESGCMRTLRRYFVDERGLGRKEFYASGYWQMGMTEDVHQVAKRAEKAD